jgi:carbon storage regulator
MLVLSRKRGETVVIGKNIEVTVLEVHEDRVKLGFSSPADVTIHREEVYQRIRREQAAPRMGCT